MAAVLVCFEGQGERLGREASFEEALDGPPRRSMDLQRKPRQSMLEWRDVAVVLAHWRYGQAAHVMFGAQIAVS